MCIKQSEPTTIFEDNQACITLNKNRVVNTTSNHIDIKYHFNREKVKKGVVALQYCPMAEMVADVMTKQLSTPQHCALTMPVM
jgi:hypothetical protein